MANLLGPKHVAQLGAYIREQRENAQYSLRQLAQVAGVSNPYLSQIERGLRKPSAEILQQLAKALEISAETLYVRAGLLDGAEAAHGFGYGYGGDGSGPGSGADSGSDASSASSPGAAKASRVIAAIADDPALNRRQKQILREIYQSFRAESAASAHGSEPGTGTDADPEPPTDATDTGLDAPSETRGD